MRAYRPQQSLFLRAGAQHGRCAHSLGARVPGSQAKPPEEVAEAEGLEFPTRPWVPPATAPAQKLKGRGSGVSAPRQRALAAPPKPKPPSERIASRNNNNPPLAAAVEPTPEPPSSRSHEQAPEGDGEARGGEAPGGVLISRERVNAVMHAVCTCLAAAASPAALAACAEAGDAYGGTLEQGKLVGYALSCDAARGSPGGKLDRETLVAVLRAVSNRRVGDLVIRAVEDAHVPGMLRYSLHDVGAYSAAVAAAAAAPPEASHDEAAAAQALIAVARSASGTDGAAMGGGGAAEDEEVAASPPPPQAARPEGRGMRVASAKRQHSAMLSGGSEGDAGAERPKRRSGTRPSQAQLRQLPAAATAASAPPASGPAFSALADVQAALGELRAEAARANRELAAQLAALRHEARAQAERHEATLAALERLSGELGASRQRHARMPSQPRTPLMPGGGGGSGGGASETSHLQAELIQLRAMLASRHAEEASTPTAAAQAAAAALGPRCQPTTPAALTMDAEAAAVAVASQVQLPLQQRPVGVEDHPPAGADARMDGA